MENNIEESATFKMEVISKKLCITVGYRKAIAQELLKSKGEERKQHLKRYKEAQEEIKRLLLID